MHAIARQATKRVSKSVVGFVLSCAVSTAAHAVVITTPNGTTNVPGNPSTANADAFSLDGGVVGPITITAEASSTRVDFTRSILVTNPSGNIMGDDTDAFIEMSQATLSTVRVTNFRLNPIGWLVRLEEPDAVFTLTEQPMVNGSVVPGISQTTEFSVDTGCTVGEFCEIIDFIDVPANISGVNEVGFRSSFIADGGVTVNVPEPTTIGMSAIALLGCAYRRTTRFDVA